MKYLLLRDNKQTGPYSAEELAAKGLKAYDLVWVEGKSAAWRYPSEIEALKSFAPVVEEQPYDRFYKKPGEQTVQATGSAQAVAETIQQVQETEQVTVKVQQPATGKHIYVTMPVSKAQTTTTPVAKKEEKTSKEQYNAYNASTSTAGQTQEKKQAASSYIISKEDDEQNSSLLAGHQSRKQEDDQINNGYLSDYEQRKAAFESKKSGSPITQKAEPVVAKKAEPVTSTRSIKKEEPWQSRKNDKIDFKALLAGPGRYLQDNKSVTRVLVAAVLILGGVVIGLVINSGHHQSDTKALESLVREIRDQQNEKSNPPKELVNETAEKSTRPQQRETRDEVSNGYTESERPTPSRTPATRDQSIVKHAVLKKELNTTPPVNNTSKSIAQPISNTNNVPVEPIPAVVESKEKATLTQEMLEKARHNIYDLVHVEASAFKVGLLGGISDLDITVINNSLYPLDQVSVEIKYFGPEKKLVKTQTIVFNNVPSGKRRTLEAPRTNRGIKIDYSVISINSKALGLAQAGN